MQIDREQLTGFLGFILHDLPTSLKHSVASVFFPLWDFRLLIHEGDILKSLNLCCSMNKDLAGFQGGFRTSVIKIIQKKGTMDLSIGAATTENEIPDKGNSFNTCSAHTDGKNRYLSEFLL